MYEPAPRLDYELPARLEYDDEIPLPHSRLTDELTRRNQLDQVSKAPVRVLHVAHRNHATIWTAPRRRLSRMRMRLLGADGCRQHTSQR